jgi:DNA-directed RNA polymerase specialized sigma subunit
MPDITSEISIENQLEARVARLTDKIELLQTLDADRWETTSRLVDEIRAIKENHANIIEAVENLKQKRYQIGQRLGVFSSHVIRKLKEIDERLNASDLVVKNLADQMNNLSLN